MELFILQVKARPASRGVSSGRRSACQCLYPEDETQEGFRTEWVRDDIMPDRFRQYSVRDGLTPVKKAKTS